MSAPESYPRRFSWPMRLLLAFLLFDMVFHSMAVLVPWREWAKEMGLERRPRRLPTRAEMASLQASGKGYGEEVMQALDSLWLFYRPWPGPDVRRNLGTWDDTGKFAVAWTCSRLALFEAVVGFDQEWPMFSCAGKRDYLTRARLVYADGSMDVLRLTAEPPDLTRYAHWNEEKVLDWETMVDSDHGSEECWGYCNYLLHRHRANAAGSPLKTIRLYEIRIDYPAPGEDARAFLADQMEQVRDGGPQTYPDFYEFDVASRKGRWLKQ